MNNSNIKEVISNEQGKLFAETITNYNEEILTNLDALHCLHFRTLSTSI